MAQSLRTFGVTLLALLSAWWDKMFPPEHVHCTCEADGFGCCYADEHTDD